MVQVCILHRAGSGAHIHLTGGVLLWQEKNSMVMSIMNSDCWR